MSLDTISGYITFNQYMALAVVSTQLLLYITVIAFERVFCIKMKCFNCEQKDINRQFVDSLNENPMRSKKYDY